MTLEIEPDVMALMRQALGLDRNLIVYRNFMDVDAASPEERIMDGLVARGLAVLTHRGSGTSLFFLSPEGVKVAIEPCGRHQGYMTPKGNCARCKADPMRAGPCPAEG